MDYFIQNINKLIRKGVKFEYIFKVGLVFQTREMGVYYRGVDASFSRLISRNRATDYRKSD